MYLKSEIYAVQKFHPPIFPTLLIRLFFVCFAVNKLGHVDSHGMTKSRRLFSQVVMYFFATDVKMLGAEASGPGTGRYQTQQEQDTTTL